ncbi:MAG: FAD-binding protein, partial [Pseudomonadota bacterium]
MLNPVTEDLIARLRAGLPDATFKEGVAAYLEDPRRRWRGQAGAVLAPASTSEVSEILRIAQQARVPVVPYGGGTGLVGGQIAPDGPAPLILSLERMRALRGIWPEENVVEVEAGMILSDLHAAAQA